MKVHDYIIELKRPAYLMADLISRLMLIISIALFSYAVFLERAFNWYTIVFTLLVIGMIYIWVRGTVRSNRGQIVYYRLGLLFATIGWVIGWRSGGPIWIPILYFIALLSEKQVKFPKEIAFDENGVTINSLPVRNYTWNLLANVVLKDNILTVDFKNNKLIQKETETDASATEEKEFNEFCKRMLNAERITQNA